MTNLEIILAGVVALQGFTSIRFELLGRQVKRSLMPPPLQPARRKPTLPQCQQCGWHLRANGSCPVCDDDLPPPR